MLRVLTCCLSWKAVLRKMRPHNCTPRYQKYRMIKPRQVSPCDTLTTVFGAKKKMTYSSTPSRSLTRQTRPKAGNRSRNFCPTRLQANCRNVHANSLCASSSTHSCHKPFYSLSLSQGKSLRRSSRSLLSRARAKWPKRHSLERS